MAKTVAPQRELLHRAQGNWFVSYTEEVTALQIGELEENPLSLHENGDKNPQVGSVDNVAGLY